jgi:hypothetical protein
VKEVLSQEDRKSLLDFLAESASDSVLVAAVSDAKAERENVRNQFLTLTKYMGIRGSSSSEGLKERELKRRTEPEEVEASGGGVSEPPGEACTRIGKNTEAMLLARFRAPQLPEAAGRVYIPHLKLLWSRGKLSWDGEKYRAA